MSIESMYTNEWYDLLIMLLLVQFGIEECFLTGSSITTVIYWIILLIIF